MLSGVVGPMSTATQPRVDMNGNGLSELNSDVVAGEDDAVIGRHGEAVPFPKAISAELQPSSRFR